MRSQTVTLRKSWANQVEARIYVQVFHGKPNNTPKKATGNTEKNDRQTDNHRQFNNSQRAK